MIQKAHLGLHENEISADAIAQFSIWFNEVIDCDLPLSNSMTLSTATPDGIPSARSVLLKSYDEKGFVFFTNYGSRKAKELDANPKATLLFHWIELERQVRIEGSVLRTSPEESEAYFRSRPRESQIGAWASHQSNGVANREALEDRARFFEANYKGQEVPWPTFWGGYRLRPSRIEFWQGRCHRLHDRLVYDKVGNEWALCRLAP